MAEKITYDSKDKLYGLAIPGTANSGMSASTTTIVAAELAGFGNDFFNTHYFMQIIKDADGAGSAPESEIRQVTDYVSASGTFTTDAFSANVEEADEFLLLHNSVVSLLSQETIMGYFALADRDDFDVADADADTQRWNTEYISGAAGGFADIDTTTSGKLYILADKDAGAERYAVSRNLEMFADFMTITEDVNVTFGATDGAAAKAVGIGVSAGAAYDSQNYIFIERQKGTGVNRIQVRSNLNNAGEVTTNVAITDDVLAFKIERWDQVWRVYYSSTQDPNYDWILASRIEDPSNYMTNAYTFYQEAFNGSAGDATETAQGDFDNFRYYVGASGGGQYIVGDYDSTHISNDVDGDVMERQEAVQKALQVVAGGGTGFEADGSGATLYKTVVAYEGLTTSGGSTTTIVDTVLTAFASDYWNGNQVVMLENNSAGVVSTIVDFDGTGTLTLDPALPSASSDGSVYIILNKHTDVPPTADSSNDRLTSDVVGTKDDTIPAMDDAPSANDSLVRHVKAILERVGVTPADPDDSVHTILGQRDATADTTAGTASHSAILNAAVAGLGLVDGGNTGFEADGTGANLYEVLVSYEGVTTGAGDSTSVIDTGLGSLSADDLNGMQLMMVTGTASGQVRTIVDFDGTSDITVEPAMRGASGNASVFVILNSKSADWIVGDNNASNAYDSSTVTADDDGSVLERLEHLKTMLVVGEGTFTTGSATAPIDTSRSEGNDFFNGFLLMPLTGSVAFQPRRIVDYTGATDTFTIDLSNPFTASTGTVAYVILADQTEFVAPVDGAAQRTPADVIGNPGDTIPAMNGAMSTSDSLFDVANAIKERLGVTPNDSDDPLHLIHGQRDDAADFTYDATTGIVPLIKGILGSRVIAEGTLDTGSATVPADSSTAGSKGNDYYNGCLLVPLTGAVAFQPRRIVDFATTTGIFTIDPNAPFSAATGTVAYLILAAQDSNYPDLLHLLVATADGGSNVYPDSVAQESILAFIMSKSANPVTTSYDNTTDSLEAISDKLATGAGNLQMAATTIDLQQAAASYDLFTGTTQAVVAERLIFRLPNVDVSDDAGAFTSISIQTDDTTPSIFLSSAAGTKANLTAEAQLGANINNGILIKTGTKIRLTIAGGAADAATVCDVIAAYRSVVSGGTLA